MKLYAIVEINDDMYDDFNEWYIRGDDLEIRYVDEGYMYYKAIPGDMLELKPLPKKKKLDEDLFLSNNFNSQYTRFKGYNECLDEILGEK